MELDVSKKKKPNHYLYSFCSIKLQLSAHHEEHVIMSGKLLEQFQRF